MTQMSPVPALPPDRRTAYTLGLAMAARIVVSLTLLFCAYFFLPTKSEKDSGSDVLNLILLLIVFGIVVGVQVPAIVRARHPVMRAVEALTLVIALYLLIFARVYLSNSLSDPAVFSHPLNHTTALYFTVTVFATVGFGDIVAATDGMRALVTVQMLMNLVVLGLIIRLLSSAAQRGVARRRQPPQVPSGPENGAGSERPSPP